MTRADEEPTPQFHCTAMPTKNLAAAVAPGQARTPSESYAFGRQQWRRKWSTFSGQWTQPQLMKLAEKTLGEKVLWSTQIRGWQTGQTRDSTVKVIMAVGHLNTAIAAANGAEVEMEEFAPRCPQEASDLWKGKHWMVGKEGLILGPAECFQAYSGLLDLGVDVRTGILCKESMPEVSKSVGRYLRFQLIKQGIDFMENDWMENPRQPSAGELLVQRLCMGKTIKAAELEHSAEVIAAEAGVSTDQLWDEAVMPALSNT